MDTFPEELLTPPVPLVALVGVLSVHPLLSAYLLQQSPPIVTLSLPDLGTAVGTLRRGRARANRPPEGAGRVSGVPGAHGSPFSGVPGAGAGGGAAHVPPPAPPPPQGILKSHWVRKHRERVPSALVLCLDQLWLAEGSPSEWAALCAALEAVKAESRSPQAKMVVLLINQGGDSAPVGRTSSGSGDEYQERLSTLKKKAETDARSCVFFTLSQPSEQTRSLARLFSLLSELTSNFYRDQVRRMRLKVERRTYTHVDLSVRYYFKMAVYHEFRREWLPAVKGYESAFLCLQEVLPGPPEQQPLQAVMEVKAVGEVITLKICTLLLHTGREVEAVGWFRNYMEWFRTRMGPPEGAFLHWTWMSRQYEVFGELLYQRLQVTGQLGDAAPPDATLPAPGPPPALGASPAGSVARELTGPSGLLLLPEGLRASLPQYLSGAGGPSIPRAPGGNGGSLSGTPAGPGTPSSTGLSTPSAASPLSSPFSSLTSTPTPSQPPSPLARGPGSTPTVPGDAGMQPGPAPLPPPAGSLPAAAPGMPASPLPLAPTPIPREEGPLGPLGDRTDNPQGTSGNPSIPPTSTSTSAGTGTGTSTASSNAQYVGPFSSQSLRVPLVARVFQLAAKHKIRYRRAYEASLITLETFGIQGLTSSTSSNRSGLGTDRQAGPEEDVLADGREDLLPPLYIGQPPRIPSRGSAPYQQRPTDAEVLLHALVSIGRLQVSSAVIELLAKAHELYRSIRARRMMSHVASEMGREYFAAHDYGSCLRLLDGVAGVYRHEAFISLLSTTLSYLRECARQLGLLQSYVSYSLELAALPLFQVTPLHLATCEGEAEDKGGPEGREALDDSGAHALSSGVMMLMTGMGRSGPKDAPARPKRRGRAQGDSRRTSAGSGKPGAGPGLALGPTGSGSELGPAGPPSEEQKRVIAREALGLLRGEREVLPAHEGDQGLRVAEDRPFQLSISGPNSQLSHLRPVLVATAAFHEPVAQCRRPVTLSLALLTHLPSALEPLELQIHFSQPGCDVTLRHQDRASNPSRSDTPTLGAVLDPSGAGPVEPSSADAQEQALVSEGAPEDRAHERAPAREQDMDLRIPPGCWKRFQLQVSAVESGILDCTSVSLRLGPNAVLACQVDPPALAPQVPCWMYEEESMLGSPLGPGGLLWLSLLGQKSLEVEQGAPQVRLDLFCPPSGLLGERVPCSMRVRSLVPHTLHSLRLSLGIRVAPVGSLPPPREASPGQPGVALGVTCGPPALQSSLPVLPRLPDRLRVEAGARGAALGEGREAACGKDREPGQSGTAPPLTQPSAAAEFGTGTVGGEASIAAAPGLDKERVSAIPPVPGEPALLPVQLLMPKACAPSSSAAAVPGGAWGPSGATAAAASEDSGGGIRSGARSGKVTAEEDGQSLVALGTSAELQLAPLKGYNEAWVTFFLCGSTCCWLDVASTLTYSRRAPSSALAKAEPCDTGAGAPSAAAVESGARGSQAAADVLMGPEGVSEGAPPAPDAPTLAAVLPSAGGQGLEALGLGASVTDTQEDASHAARGGLRGAASLAGWGHDMGQVNRALVLQFEEPMVVCACLSGAWHTDTLLLPGHPRGPGALPLAKTWEQLGSPGGKEKPASGPQRDIPQAPAGDAAGTRTTADRHAGLAGTAVQGLRASWDADDAVSMQPGRGSPAVSGKDAGPDRRSSPNPSSSSSWPISGPGLPPASPVEAPVGPAAAPPWAGRGGATGATVALLCLGEQSSLAVLVQGLSNAAIRLLAMEVTLTHPNAFKLQLASCSPHSISSTGLPEEGSSGEMGPEGQAAEDAGPEVEPAEGPGMRICFSRGKGVVLRRDETFCQLLLVTPLLEPQGPQPAALGTVTFTWQRAVPQEVPWSAGGEPGREEVPPVEGRTENGEPRGQPPGAEGRGLPLVMSQFELPLVLVEVPALQISLDCPPVAHLGRSFTYSYTLSNRTEALMEISFQVQDVPSFVFAGTHSGSLSLLPCCSVRLTFQLVPIAAGLVAVPPIRLLASHHSAKFVPSAPSSRLFVYPGSAG